jgi:hypothetical protein
MLFNGSLQVPGEPFELAGAAAPRPVNFNVQQASPALQQAPPEMSVQWRTQAPPYVPRHRKPLLAQLSEKLRKFAHQERAIWLARRAWRVAGAAIGVALTRIRASRSASECAAGRRAPTDSDQGRLSRRTAQVLSLAAGGAGRGSRTATRGQAGQRLATLGSGAGCSVSCRALPGCCLRAGPVTR